MPVFDNLDRKQVFIMFKWNVLYFNFCPLSLVLSLAITKKSLVLTTLHPSLDIYIIE